MSKNKNSRTQYLVVVSYNAKHYFDRDISDPEGPEKVIPKYLKKRECGSGCGFGKRDLDFWFRSKKDAEKVKAKIAKAPWKKKWGVTVSSVYGDDD